MQNITITVQDSCAFDTFELSAEQLKKLEMHKMNKVEIDALVDKLLNSLNAEQMLQFELEAFEAEITVKQQMRSVLMLAVGDYLGSIA